MGTIDSLRATQIMETVLTKVSEEQAKVLILDIAGVPVVDTKVADHLLKTTAAVRLLGAKTILTGISAQVARTIIQLGVDISSMETQSRLQDGIELALSMVGKAITAKGAQVARGSIPILRVGDTLLATVHVDLRDDVAEAFQEDVLTELEKRRAAGLLIDVSGLDMVDTYVARILSDTGRMARLMGADTVIVGIRPDVAATLIRMGYAMDGVLTAMNVDDGMATLAARAAERKRG